MHKRGKRTIVLLACILCLFSGCSNKIDTMQVLPELYLNTPTTTITEAETIEEEPVTYDILTDVLSEVVIVEDDVDRASKRLAQFHKRLNSSNIRMKVKQLTTRGTAVTECDIDAYYYADCVNVHYKDDITDIGMIIMGEDGYLLDSVSNVAYSVATCDVRFATSSSLVSMFSTQDGAYMGTCEQQVSDTVVLSADIYYVDNVVYKMCYTQDTDTLIMTIRIDSDSECCSIFEALTTVEDMRIFEIPDGYVYLRYEDYLEAHQGENDKFALFII